MKRIIGGLRSGGIWLYVLAFIVFCSSTGHAKIREKPLVQIAILLDTSNSMDGLIAQAKSQLWKVINEFACAERRGVKPVLQVALYEYGNNNIPEGENYVRMVLSFTSDLDRVSEELFALRTNGGNEYCGTVIRDAVRGLSWDCSHDNYKAVFIAGNEPFTQGNVNYWEACKAAIAEDVIINTIFCGSYSEGAGTGWKAGAELAYGEYMNIDQNKKAVHIDAPQDEKISRLGELLNKTYLPYGLRGMESKDRQAEQEKNACRVGKDSFLQRQVAKSSSHYRNDSWDLVDAIKKNKVKIEDLADSELPEEMQRMSGKERKVYVEGKQKERERIQAKIVKLNEARKKYVAEEMKKLSCSGEDTLDVVMIKTIRRQASQKKFTFK